MKLMLSAGAALLALYCVAAPADAGAFKGTYALHYLSGPSHAETNDICAVFKHTGDIDGFPDSGTWHAKTPEGLQKGNFIVDQGILRFYGPVIENVYMINHYAPVADKFTTGTYNQWVATKPLTAERDGTFSMSKGCAGG